MDALVVVEGESDREAALALCRICGVPVATVTVKNGAPNLDALVPNYVRLARHQPVVVLRDADRECPVTLCRRLVDGLGPLPERFTLRIACSMTEAWLLADAAGFADFFGVSEGKVPVSPDELPHAKNSLLALCSGSRKRQIREEVVTRTQRPGPLYVPTLNEFARTAWDVAAACDRSPSLRRAVERLSALAVTLR